ARPRPHRAADSCGLPGPGIVRQPYRSSPDPRRTSAEKLAAARCRAPARFGRSLRGTPAAQDAGCVSPDTPAGLERGCRPDHEHKWARRPAGIAGPRRRASTTPLGLVFEALSLVRERDVARAL